MLATILEKSVRALYEPERLFEDGIAKHFITKGVFSEDRQVSILRAEAGVCKLLIKEIEKYSKTQLLEEAGSAF